MTETSVTGKTSIKIDELVNGTVISGRVQDGNLILTTRGGAEINAGFIGGGGGTPDPDPVGTAISYETAAPNQMFAIHRDALTGTWPSSRPSDRADLTFDVTGVEPSPTWLTENDRRSIPIGEGGMLIFEEDLMTESGGGTYGTIPQTYETVIPTSYFVIYRDETTGEWPVARPSPRTDVIFEACGLDPSPTWLINRDRRSLPKP